jgi:lysophospholipase L1-like esterase/LysM repeat protein
MKYIIFSLLFIFFFKVSFSQDNIEIDSNAYPWYSPSLNYLQFYSKNSLSNFYEALKNVKTNRVSIIQFGDSHIQSEIPTQETRFNLQKKYGNGGRGMVFPYSTAKTYSSIHYSTKHSGNWAYTKSNKETPELPKGLMCISSKTNDSTASFTITFNSKIPTNQLKINLFCETDSLSYDMILETDGNSTPIDIFRNNENKGFVTFSIPSISNTLTFKCLKTAKNQKQFIIHGLEIINPENKGIIFYSSGIGGAKFNSLLNIENFNKELKVLNPDLVILDFGTNDFLFSDSIKETLGTDIKNTIASIRKASPLASILICTTQDLFYKQKNLESTVKYLELIKKIAKETEVAYWDWFSVSGGKGSLKTWLNQGLAKTDLIHLTNAGYRIKGKLLFEAIENTKIRFETIQNENIINQKPKKIDLSAENKIQINTINSLSNRETIKAEKIKMDSVNSISLQNEILKNDSIKISIPSQISSKENDTLKKGINQTSPINSLKQTTNLNLKTDTILKSKNQTIVNNPPKTTSDIFRNETNNEVKSRTIEAPEKIKTNNLNTVKKSSNEIKIEIEENINDSSIVNLEINKELNNMLSNKNNKKNYEIARERQHEILEHDTLAIKILTDNIRPKKKINKPRNQYYKVKNGDNLSFIAEKFHVSVKDIKTWNRLKSDDLSIGQSIIIKK